jgi:hypothetical protein
MENERMPRTYFSTGYVCVGRPPLAPECSKTRSQTTEKAIKTAERETTEEGRNGKKLRRELKKKRVLRAERGFEEVTHIPGRELTLLPAGQG